MELMENQKISGFQLERKREIPECQGTLYEFIHVKTHARLVYLATKDVNKHFSVTFKTLPEDDSGVFHILEHSVLCGSDRYPVKEPFVELLKSSMNTFLNAMTFPDKTMYPVSSKNEQDFLNLTDVYLDAVFHPAIYHNKKIFEQEGWHIELRQKDDAPVYKGVVLNEMKGANSSVDTMIDNEMMRGLYPDNAYQYISGGDAKSIVKLSYESFLAHHQKFYHPSNAIFYLEGDLHLETVLKMIGGYLKDYDASYEKIELPLEERFENKDIVSYYPVAQGEDVKEKTQISFGKIAATYDDPKKIFAINILSDYLTGSNDAPLKKAILDAHLAQDFYTAVTDGIMQPFFTVGADNTEADRKDEIKSVMHETIGQILRDGINKTQLSASLNQLEFTTRDIGEPKALMRNLLVLSSMLYGGDPALYLSYNAIFASLKDALSTHYYEDLLSELFDEKGVVSVTMIPDETLNAKMQEDEAHSLQAIKEKMSEDEINALIKENEDLDTWHETPDSKEALATIPKLSLSDLNKEPEKLETKVETVDGITVLTHPSSRDGIVYMNVYFKLDVASHEDLSAYSFLPNLLGSLPTKRSLTELLYDMKANTGRLSFDIGATSRPGDLDHVDVYLMVKTNVLKTKVKEAVRLMKEVLTETDFSQKALIKTLFLQIQDDFRNDIINNGHRYAMRHTLSGYSKEAFFNEVVDGLDAYDYLNDLLKHFDEKSDAFIEKIVDLLEHQLIKNRMIISVTTPHFDEDLKTDIHDLISNFEEGKAFTGANYDLPAVKNVGMIIPNGVSYACLGGNLYHLDHEYNGRWRVISSLLSYYYLWNEVRVKGGAYGTGFACGSLGTLAYYSYRDPNVSSALNIYKHAGNFLRDFVKSDEGIEEYIISSIAKTEPLRSDRGAGDLADGNYLRDITYEDEVRLRNDMLEMKKEDLLAYADILDALAKDCVITVIGHEQEIEACKNDLEEIKTL